MTIGRVYKIVNEDETVCYIGSTKHILKYRLSNHLSSYKFYKANKIKKKCSIYDAFDSYGIQCFKIKLIEQIDYIDREELRKLEDYYISITECINKYKAYRSEDERIQYHQNYRAINFERTKIYQKEYRLKNADRIRAYQQAYRARNRL